jgi:hypothetical protein
MRAAALARIQGIQAEANEALDSHVNAGLVEARTFAREELKDLRRSINTAQSSFYERRGSAEATMARLALIGTGEIDENGAEGQAILTEAFEQMTRYQDTLGGLVGGAGQALGAVPNPYAMAAGAAVSAIGATLDRQGSKLSYSDTLKAFQAQQDALDKFAFGDGAESEGFLPQLEKSLADREGFARDKLGIPIDESWRARRFTFPDAPQMPREVESQRDLDADDRNAQLGRRGIRRPTR